MTTPAEPAPRRPGPLRVAGRPAPDGGPAQTGGSDPVDRSRTGAAPGAASGQFGGEAPAHPPRAVDDPRWVVPERSPGGGYDRVGGSRLTGPGAVLVAIVIFTAASPVPSADRQLFTVVWAALLATVVIGIVTPLVLVRRVGVAAASPRDAVVGEEVLLTVTLTGHSAGLEVRGLDPTGPWHRVAAPGSGELPHLADRRGLFPAMRLEVRVTAPLGILAVHRVHEVLLPHAVEVAPRSISVSWLPAPAPVEVASGADHTALASPTGDLVRSVRPYVSGDPPHLVHWPSTARTGDLVVRELEPPVPVGQAVVVDLRDLGADTERAAAYGLGACRAVLAAGGHLVLATCEVSGPVVGPVRSVLDAGRRLARAVPGPPGTPPEGWSVVEIGA